MSVGALMCHLETEHLPMMVVILVLDSIDEGFVAVAMMAKLLFAAAVVAVGQLH